MPKKIDKHLDGEILNSLCSVFQTRMGAFSNYSNQVWNRFNWLLTLQVGIAGFFLTNHSSDSYSSKATIFLALLICILWLLMGIEDRKNLKKHSERVETCHQKILEEINPKGIKALRDESQGNFSQTSLLYLFPAISMIGWVIVILKFQ